MHRILILALLGLAVLPTSVSASPLAAKLKFQCGSNGVKREDPLTNPGPPGTLSDHTHFWACATRFGADITAAKLIDGPTTAFLPGQDAVYWGPVFVAANGETVPGTVSGYYAAAQVDTRAISGGRVQPFPLGLSILAGDPKSAGLQSTNIVRWRCSQGVATYDRPPLELNCGSIQGEVDFPNCWDGKRLDSPDHKAHMAYATAVTIAGGAKVSGCPSTHPVAVPQIQAQASYPKPKAGWAGAFLSSDHGVGPSGRTFHLDVIQAEQFDTQALWLSCLNDTGRDNVNDPSCGVFTYASTNPGTLYEQSNPWASALRAQLGRFPLYVKPDGSAQWPPAMLAASSSVPLCHLARGGPT